MADVNLTVDKATAILNEAKSDGAYEDPIPDSDSERISVAKELYESAKSARASGVALPVVEAILSIAEGDLPPFEISEPEPVAEVEEKPKAKRSTKKSTEALPIDDFFAKEKLPLPSEITWDVQEMPADLTTLSDAEVRRLHGQYHAYHSRTTWLLAQEENDLNASEHLYEIAFAKAIKAIGGDKITVAKVEAAADPEVIRWKESIMLHAPTVKKLKALCSIYESSCNRLSREWTMRSEERGTSGNLPSAR